MTNTDKANGWVGDFDSKFGTLRFRGVANGAIKDFIRKVKREAVERTIAQVKEAMNRCNTERGLRLSLGRILKLQALTDGKETA